ncbi:hypothetical protein AMK27_11235 [Streptomyces sp. CB02009]|nr:hypothetical protein AMK27_11235 [Streptomyces sp. CB02009]
MSRRKNWASPTNSTGPSCSVLHGRPDGRRPAARALRISSGAYPSDSRRCGSWQSGHGSSSGHSIGPPTWLSCMPGLPGLGCNRVARAR